MNLFPTLVICHRLHVSCRRSTRQSSRHRIRPSILSTTAFSHYIVVDVLKSAAGNGGRVVLPTCRPCTLRFRSSYIQVLYAHARLYSTGIDTVRLRTKITEE